MINIIVAVDKNYGIGKDNKLPWSISEELKLFKKKTNDSILIVGRKTFEKLPNLKNRIVFLWDFLILFYHNFLLIIIFIFLRTI